MRSVFTPEDWAKVLDWAVLFALGGAFAVALGVILGLAVFLFRLIGGV